MKIFSFISLFWLIGLFNFTTAKEEATMQNTATISLQEITKTPPWETHLMSQKDFIELSEKLVRQIKTPQDLTLERIERITGLKFELNPNGRAMYIYAIRFDDATTAAFLLSIEHKTEEQEIVRPRFSINALGNSKPFFFDPIKLFEPIVEELGYKEIGNDWNLQIPWLQYAIGTGEDRLVLTMPYDSKFRALSLDIEAKKYVKLGGSHW